MPPDYVPNVLMAVGLVLITLAIIIDVHSYNKRAALHAQREALALGLMKPQFAVAALDFVLSVHPIQIHALHETVTFQLFHIFGEKRGRAFVDAKLTELSDFLFKAGVEFSGIDANYETMDLTVKCASASEAVRASDVVENELWEEQLAAVRRKAAAAQEAKREVRQPRSSVRSFLSRPTGGHKK